MKGIHQSQIDSPYNGSIKRSFDVFFVVRLNNLLNEQSGYRWFQTPWRSCDVTLMDRMGMFTKKRQTRRAGNGGNMSCPKPMAGFRNLMTYLIMEFFYLLRKTESISSCYLCSICMHINLYPQIHTHKHTHARICMHICVCVCVRFLVDVLATGMF